MQPIKIALTDDHTLLRNALVVLINKFDGCEVICDVNSGNDLVTAMKRGVVPDVVIISLALPETDCYDTTEYLQTNYPNTHVLVLSPFNSEMAMIRLLQCGAKGFLRKNIQPDELKRAIFSAMELGYYYSDHVVGKLFGLFRKNENAANELAKRMLTMQEHDFLRLACSDRTYKEIADEMGMNVRAVDNMRDQMFIKLDVKSRVGMVMTALRNGIVTGKI